MLTFKEHTELQHLEESLGDSWAWFKKVIPMLQKKYAKFKPQAIELGNKPTQRELAEFGKMIAPGGLKDLGLFSGINEDTLNEEDGNIILLIAGILFKVAGLSIAYQALPVWAFIGLLVWSALTLFAGSYGWKKLRAIYKRHKAKQNTNDKEDGNT